MIKKFHASTTRDALRQVRDALGADAIILSNRQVAGGIEIIAVADLDMASLAEQAEAVTAPQSLPRAAAPARPAVMDAAIPSTPTSFAAYLAQREASVIRPTPARRPAAPPLEPRPEAVAPAPTANPETATVAPVMQELAREMRELRGLVEGQLAGLAWNDTCRREPYRAEIMKRLLAASFSPALTRQLLERMPAEPDHERAMKWICHALAHNLKVADVSDDLIDQGGVYALVGPTGVGKTTTVAKLAARAVLRHGAGKVAMVTTDSYRIGAQDQLRIYGRILGTPVFAVRDEGDLELTLLDLAGKHLVFIDTIGMSQRDKRVMEQTSLLGGSGQAVKRLLLLSAPAQGITLEEVVRAYQGPGLEGCILTKIDEALTYGPVLDVVIRHQLRVRYVTNGQRVPEDMHLANARFLVDRAFRLGAPDPAFTPEDGDYPVLMAAASQPAAEAAAYPLREAQGAVS